MESAGRSPKLNASGVGTWHYQHMCADEIYTTAHQALELMYKHEIPPEPILYSVWFAYVSNACERLVGDIDGRINTAGCISKFELLEMHKLYIEDNGLDDARQGLGAELGESLESISQLIRKSTGHQETFSESLKSSTREIDQVDSIEHLQAIAGQMLATNRKMSRITSELNADLIESQTKIDILNEKLETLEKLNLCDALTGVSNRRAFDARLKNEVEHAEASSSALCLALVDLDHFKKVNDEWGHQAGDEMLKSFARFLEAHTPNETMVARYGGEEFAIILTETGIVDAHNLMVEVLRGLRKESLSADYKETSAGTITASIGLASYKPDRSVSELIMIADEHLYAAKKGGRDRVKSEGLG